MVVHYPIRAHQVKMDQLRWHVCHLNHTKMTASEPSIKVDLANGVDPDALGDSNHKEDPNFKSYLDSDGIDELKPAPRKDVSSISLSDQWAGSMQNMAKYDRGATVGLDKDPAKMAKSQSILSKIKGNDGSGTDQVRYKKTIIDHPRIASYAFAFDIDGVLLNGPNTIPQAPSAIRMLNGDNKYRIHVPYIFVTNGGGKPEVERAENLSQRLGCDISVDQIIQGHTPMRMLCDTYENVLVVGGEGDTCRKIAEGYGFHNVYTPLDIMYWDPSVTPYYNLTDADKKCCKKDVDFSKVKIEAIFVFADSRNWAADEQIILDLLMSKGGYMKTISDTFTEGPGLYFAHSDFIWSTDYPQARYGMGALQVSIAALFKESTGRELKVTRFGKPQRTTFKFAERLLSNWRTDVLEEYVEVMANDADKDVDANKENSALVEKSNKKADVNRKLFAESDSESDDDSDGDQVLTIQNLAKTSQEIPPASTVYFIGDTPASDIRFGNQHDLSWFSILVKTGVYQEGTKPQYPPKHICDNVLEAVKYAIDREAAKELNEWNATAIDEPQPS